MFRLQGIVPYVLYHVHTLIYHRGLS
eukprot:SAG11_NODE_32475_length_283_cov_0.842391_1_plen_25_part_10